MITHDDPEANEMNRFHCTLESEGFKGVFSAVQADDAIFNLLIKERTIGLIPY